MNTTVIVLLPIDNFERQEANNLEHSEICQVTQNDLQIRGAEFYPISDFMEMCNDESIDLTGHWLTYLKIE